MIVRDTNRHPRLFCFTQSINLASEKPSFTTFDRAVKCTEKSTTRRCWRTSGRRMAFLTFISRISNWTAVRSPPESQQPMNKTGWLSMRFSSRDRTSSQRRYVLITAIALAVLYFGLMELMLIDSSRALREAQRFRSRVVASALAESAAELAAAQMGTRPGATAN